MNDREPWQDYPDIRVARKGGARRRRPTPVRAVTMIVEVGTRVRLNTPDNPRLHGAEATVVTMEQWGAHVNTPAAATHCFRAVWEEMEPLDYQPAGQPGTATKEIPPLIPHPVAVESPPGVIAGINSSNSNGAEGYNRPTSRGVLATSSTARRAKDTDILNPTGEICARCQGVRMVRSGSCLTCLDCGESGGCV